MNIKKAIKDAGWTLERLAAEMPNRQGGKGISQSSMSQMVSGNPTLDKLVEISNIIGVSLSDLVKDEEEKSNTLTCPQCGAIFELKN